MTRTPQELAGTRDWTAHASCVGIDTEQFYYTDGNGDPLPEVLRICGRCDVAVECLIYALDIDRDAFEHGVWGGTTPRDREKLERYVRRVHCPLCDSRQLITHADTQVCCSCAVTWPTRRPGARPQIRVNGDAA